MPTVVHKGQQVLQGRVVFLERRATLEWEVHKALMAQKVLKEIKVIVVILAQVVK